jgi:phasin
MAKQSPNPYDIPDDMRDFAAKSVDQARKAIDGFIGAAHKAVDTLGKTATHPVHNNATDMTKKTLSHAEENIAAAFDHMQKMVNVRDPMEFFKLQSEFVQQQVTALQAQMKDLGGMVQKAASDATASKK